MGLFLSKNTKKSEQVGKSRGWLNPKSEEGRKKWAKTKKKSGSAKSPVKKSKTRDKGPKKGTKKTKKATKGDAKNVRQLWFSRRASRTAADKYDQSVRGREQVAPGDLNRGNANRPSTLEQAPSQKKSASGQHTAQKNVGTGATKGESKDTNNTSADADGCKKSRRSRRGGVRNARRRENRERREREAALLGSSPEQRGSIQGQRAVDRRSMIEQPWRRGELFAQGGTKEDRYRNLVGDEKHKVESKGGQDAPTKAIDVSVIGSLPRKPVSSKAVEFDIKKTIPTEPKSDRLARERRASKAGGAEGIQTVFSGHNNSAAPRIEGLPDYKFGNDEWSLKESAKSDDGKGDDADHKAAGVEKQKTNAPSALQQDDSPDTGDSTISPIDWVSIRQRMESKLGKPTTKTPKAESDIKLPEPEVKETAKIEGSQYQPAKSKDTSTGWSFDKVL